MATQSNSSPDKEPAAADEGYCHFQHWSLTHWLLAGLVLLAVVYTLYFARAILAPVMVAIILAFLLNPIVRRLGRIGLPNWISAGIVVAGGLLMIFLAIYSLSGPASNWIKSAPENLQVVEYKLRTMRGTAMEDIDQAREQIKKIATMDEEGVEPVIEIRQEQPALTTTVFGWTGGVAISTSITIVLAYFLLASKESTRRMMMALASSYSGRRGLVEMALEIEQGVSLYLLTMTVINVCLGIAIGSTMWLLGMPNPVLWGVMAGLLNYAPYIGPTVGAIVVGLVALITFDSAWYAALAPLCYLGWNTIEGQFLTPAIVGRWMKISPLAILASIIFWGWIWGPLGILLAVPMLATGLIMFRHILDFVPQPLEQESTDQPPEEEMEHQERCQTEREAALV